MNRKYAGRTPGAAVMNQKYAGRIPGTAVICRTYTANSWKAAGFAARVLENICGRTVMNGLAPAFLLPEKRQRRIALTLHGQ